MPNVAHQSDSVPCDRLENRPRSIARFAPGDPAQMVYRKLLADFDEDDLVDLESEIEYFLAGGPMSPALSAMLGAADGAA
jgi:hypothetical protein